MSLWLFWACAQAPVQAEPQPAEVPQVEQVEQVEQAAESNSPRLARVERVTAGADPSAPLPIVVMLHGLGDDPENFVNALRGWDTPARLIALEAPHPWGDGHAWFTVRARDGDLDAMALQARESAAKVVAELEDLGHETCGKPVVTGFSQGGILSFTLAAHHPDTLAAAVPVAGWLPEPLLPESVSEVVPIRALHGDADRVLALSPTQDSVVALEQRGADVTLQVFPGVGHAIPPEVRQAWYDALDALVCTP